MVGDSPITHARGRGLRDRAAERAAAAEVVLLAMSACDAATMNRAEPPPVFSNAYLPIRSGTHRRP